ncbi:MAG: prepilin peptidase [bacterium]|nr:prepilin peptidase [bacterium]
MTTLFSASFFMFGAILASFVGVVAGRLYTGQSFLRGVSRCDACGKPLSAWSLIPIFSYTASSGRAHCCRARISPLAPLGELTLGALFTLGYLQLGLSLELGAFLLALTLLAALVLYDLAHQILPPPLLALFVATAAFAGYVAQSDWPSFLATLGIAALFALFFALLHFLSGGRAMGLADTPLVFGLALLVGPAALPGFLFSFWIGAGVGIVLLAASPHGSRMGIEVPFAPFLAAGFLLAYFTQWDPLALTAALMARLI